MRGDPATAQISGRFWVDNFVVAVRLNDQSVTLPPGRNDGYNYRTDAEIPLHITTGFKSGLNVLEFTVFNELVDPQGTRSANPIAFRAELSGSAQLSE